MIDNWRGKNKNISSVELFVLSRVPTSLLPCHCPRCPGDWLHIYRGRLHTVITCSLTAGPGAKQDAVVCCHRSGDLLSGLQPRHPGPGAGVRPPLYNTIVTSVSTDRAVTARAGARWTWRPTCSWTRSARTASPSTGMMTSTPPAGRVDSG